MMEFPSFEWWRTHVVTPGDGDAFQRRDRYEHYLLKHALAALARPAALCEIGVRYGYSAWSFLRAAPRAAYLGLDLQQGTHGGVKGVDTFDYVRRLLARDFPEALVELRRVDTRTLARLDGAFDFLHVDGDHSEAGCRHDLDLALAACRPGGIVLVDDYDYIAGVRRAVDRTLVEAADRIDYYSHLPSLRGEMLFVRK